MRKIDEWRKDIADQINAFKEEQQIQMQIGPDTRYGGVVSVKVENADIEQINELRTLLISLNPPRPIHWMIPKEESEGYGIRGIFDDLSQDSIPIDD